MSSTLQLFRGSGFPGSDIQAGTFWNSWIRREDENTRARVNRGIEDSISNLILYDTSYTNLPRLDGPDQAVSESGEILPAARARVHALLIAIPSAHGERLRFVDEFLMRKHLAAQSQRANFLVENLKRFAQEQRAYEAKLHATSKSQDAGKMFETRGSLYSARGLSVDTSLLPNYGLEETLRALTTKGVLSPDSIRRIAVIGPGLDFTDKREGYDFYPLQTTQPFAVMEAVLRLKLGEANNIDVVTLDLNPLVNSHIAALAGLAQEHKAYTIQLPHDPEADWNPLALDYWKHFGDVIGRPAEPLPIPAELRGTINLRAVSIPPQFTSRVQPLDLDIVAQTLEGAPGFDLVVATNTWFTTICSNRLWRWTTSRT